MATGEVFEVGQRVHWAGNAQRIGTVKFVGTVEGHDGQWVGVVWDAGDGKHDGTLNGVGYFQVKSAKSGSFGCPHNLCRGIVFLEALHLRYRSQSTQHDAACGEEKVMDKLSQQDERKLVSLVYQGVSSFDDPSYVSPIIPSTLMVMNKPTLIYLPTANGPNGAAHAQVGIWVKNMEKLDLTGNLLYEWKVDILKGSLPSLEELHLMGNNISLTQVSVTLKCIGASLGEKPSPLKLLPGSTTLEVNDAQDISRGRGLLGYADAFFCLWKGSPFPIPLDDDQASLVDMGGSAMGP